ELSCIEKISDDEYGSLVNSVYGDKGKEIVVLKKHQVDRLNSYVKLEKKDISVMGKSSEGALENKSVEGRCN
ncbi:hypothetical protein HAX54_031480, partial [Datura stramonium]|nr:hypothetical protein [Datura stramonium]